MADLAAASNIEVVKDARRSTRISESVRLSVSGQSEVGSSFSELTLTLAVNCHGCIYPSRNEHRTGSWVTLEFPNQPSDPKMRPVRALVRFVRTPRNPKDHYLVGVELENPANVWRVHSIPKDWLRFPILGNGSAGAPQTTAQPTRPLGLDPVPSSNGSAELMAQASAISADAGKLGTPSADQLLRTLEKNLQHAAEKAVAAAVNSHLNSAVNKAITAIDKFSQASVRQVEKQCTLYQEKLINAAREEVLRRLEGDLAHAEQRLQNQLETSLTEVEEKIQGLAKSETSEAHLILAESVDFLKETARNFQGEFSMQLRETTDRAAAELSAETVRFSDRQLGLLAKQAHAAIGDGAKLLETRAAEASSQLESRAADASSQLETRAAETSSQLQTVAGTMLSDFRQKATTEIDQAAADVRDNFTTSLTSIAEGIRCDWESRERAWQEEVVRSREQHGEQFRQRLETILHASIVNAVSAVNEHSRNLLSSLSKETDN